MKGRRHQSLAAPPGDGYLERGVWLDVNKVPVKETR